MKKLISSFMIAVTLFTAMPVKKADAGLAVLAVGVGVYAVCISGESSLNRCENIYGNSWFAAAGFFLTGLVLDIVTLGVLDADGSLPKEKLEASLAARYSFINDNQAISDLADAIKTKAASQKPVDGKIEVKLSPAEVKSILEPTGLLETNPKDVAKLIKELN